MLNQARIDALDGTADALKKIIRQKELTRSAGEGGLAEIGEAVNSAEEAMFYLAAASAQDEDDARSILSGYGLERLLPDCPSEGE